MRTTVEGALGGSIVVTAEGRVTVFFCERYIMGCPCHVDLGPALDALLSLQPGEHLRWGIEGIDDIHAARLPGGGEVMLYFVSTFHHATNIAIVSQEKLCLAAVQMYMPVKA